MITKNEFLVGHKLEAFDPRNESSICIATVIATHGIRLRLRLDGSDDRNDFWRVCDDSKKLFPFEYSAKKNIKIQPPIGFLKDLSKWELFLEKMIRSAGQGLFNFAPETAFKAAPQVPPCNMFKVGQKLEAVDLKSPHMIFPATVREVSGDRILVGFDGFNRQGEYWCHYASRDIFPVGWCQSTGHFLNNPGNLPEKRSLSKEKKDNTSNVQIKRNVSSSCQSDHNNNVIPKKNKIQSKPSII